MKIIDIHGQTGASKIAVGESLENLKNYLPKRKTVIITDTNVNRLYAGRFPDLPKIVIGTGENIKTLQTVEYIFDQLLRLEVDRSSYIVGIGGGIACDITGFAASTYMRGVGFGFVSTTLLSQVDASVGGKNGVNFHGYKNMVGVFNQPDFVICDPAMLKTLPEKELTNGFAEIVKHACLSSGDLFDFLEDNYEAALTLEPQVIEKLVYDSVQIKAAVVNRDEKEKGERRKLNFGHTLGHALEKTLGLSHGEAVSLGMVFAADLSVRRGLLEKAAADRLKQLLEKIKLPTKIEQAAAAVHEGMQNVREGEKAGVHSGVSPGYDSGRVLDALKKDKKREGAGIHFVLLKSFGDVVIEEIPISELEKAIGELPLPGREKHVSQNRGTNAGAVSSMESGFENRLCISIADVGFEECTAALQGVELAEIRLDRLDFSAQQVGEIFSLPCRLIATHRPGKISEEKRKVSLINAIQSGAAYVDIEIEAGDSFKKEVIETARGKGCKVIISYHDFEKTPEADQLTAIAASCFEQGAAIAKIACMAHSEADSARLLALYDSPAAIRGKILALGMGEKGKITRIAALLLGAPFTFAAPGAGRETAPGQIDRRTLEHIIQMVKP